MEFKLVKVIFKNIKLKTKDGKKEFTASAYYLEHEGLRGIMIKPCSEEDYSKLDYLAEKRFSDYQPKTKDNSEDLLK